MSKRVVVTGLGAITPLGDDVPTTWNAVLEGVSGVDRIRRFDPSDLKTQFAAEVKDFDPTKFMSARDARKVDRFTQFAQVAAGEAVADSGLDMESEDPSQVGVLVGSAVGGIISLLEQAEMMRQYGARRVSPFTIPALMVNAAAGQVAITFGLQGPNLAVATACATGSHAIGEAAAIVGRGDAQVMLAGGSEAGIVPVAIAGFNVMGALSTRNEDPQGACRPFEADRGGFVIGEGSAMMVLESLEHALARGARIYGEVLGYGATADAFHITAPAQDGKGAALAMEKALQRAAIPPESVDYINAHGTGTLLNDASETAAIKMVFGDHAYKLAVSSTKSMTGHLLGAAGAIEAIFCLLAMRDQTLPPTINYVTPDPALDLDYVPNVARRRAVNMALSNSFGFGGHNASLVLGRFAAN
ncbi:MAG TPA: beta-ketoacyl-ACP synthase II [Anaerolineae bacterium]|nr:beta-ketoacyl-ACP synthase II [Anaerolineae bacterium]